MNNDIGYPEEMESFFDKRADTYEAHMAEYPSQHWRILLEKQLPETSRNTRILDLGCGTGLEIRHIFNSQPNTHITCLDLSESMLAEFKKIHRDSLPKLTIIRASYFDYDMGQDRYDQRGTGRGTGDGA